MTEVVLSGPIFDRGEQIMEAWGRDLLDAYGAQGLSHIGQIMDASFRNPTPYYETQVTYDAAGDVGVIHDRGIVYGPWLEGVGSRNARSRFKGYHMFRRTRQFLIEDTTIVDRMIPDLVRRLGG